MIILGIDPGLQKTGWGLVKTEGNALSYINSGLIKPNVKDALAQRLSYLHNQLAIVIERYNPDAAAVEETFVNKNPASALKLGQARGVCLCAPAIQGLDVAEYAANLIKKSIVGNGHASKSQIGMMVKTLLPASGELTEDEADAMAVAITHAHCM